MNKREILIAVAVLGYTKFMYTLLNSPVFPEKTKPQTLNQTNQTHQKIDSEFFLRWTQ